MTHVELFGVGHRYLVHKIPKLTNKSLDNYETSTHFCISFRPKNGSGILVGRYPVWHPHWLHNGLPQTLHGITHRVPDRSTMSSIAIHPDIHPSPTPVPSSYLAMKISSLVEVTIAGHFSNYVDSPFSERGGMLFVAPPGQLKSTIIKTCFEPYPDTMVLSDINVQTMNPLRDELANGRYKTMAFTAFEKIYERDPRTSSNVEGQLKAMACEGFSEASFEDHRMQGVFESRAFILGAMIPALYRRKFPEWIESGFARRFLWSFYRFDDPDVLVNAIHEWRRIELEHNIPVMPMRRIKFDVTEEESYELLTMVRYQPSRESPFVLLKKVLSVLKWRYPKDNVKPMEILRDFSTSMGKRPTTLVIDIERQPERRKDAGGVSTGTARRNGNKGKDKTRSKAAAH